MPDPKESADPAAVGLKEVITTSRIRRVSVGLLVGFCLLVWVGWFVWGKVQGLEGGSLGDWFGGLTALFTVLAFLGLTRQVQLQGEELADTRSVLRAQKDELAAQVAAMDRQAAATARLHEQAEERTKHDHALRVLGAYQDWMAASRKAWQAVTRYLTYKRALMATLKPPDIPGTRPIRRTALDMPVAEAKKIEAERSEWFRRAEEAIIAVDAAANAVDALDPHQLPDVNWQRIVENDLGCDGMAEFKRCSDAFSDATARLRRRFPRLE